MAPNFPGLWRTNYLNMLTPTLYSIIYISGIVSSTATPPSLPPPTGPYNVGVRKYTIEHLNTHDPVAPNNVSTAFLATIFYPTLQKHQGPLLPYLNPETAASFEQSWNYTNGTLASITSTLQPNASILDPKELAGKASQSLPTILFGPGGGGPPVEASTILLSELASHGYAVIGLDHPFEQPFIRYPNGTGVFGVDIDYGSGDLLTALYDMRVGDNAAFLSTHLPALARGGELPLSTANVGALGYSLGGAAALGSLQSEGGGLLVAGLNLDGTMWGAPALNSSAADVRRPSFLLGNEGHGGEDGGDYTWVSFPVWQTGPRWKMLVNGTSHHDFCDDAFWKTVQPGADQDTGTIEGLRMLKVLNAYVRAFFDFTVLGGREEGILEGPDGEFPEVVVVDVS
ncbi:uncharacterized protein GGS25DRAFT_532405 [Hypoxylon fragiforme]|uniref:uncharacterized protein n=1 Tax=Hypoxylon fragiforme TaxID=63214 RepID=UPI0020C70941|nr:uncharacterized protein GGS25DRAFT_532405 [Hypoxylon fragiforme]KAI2607176.1 hypothetical protein GGS25DRAFT_532405 [Hypoxylon fragiforme]